MKKIVYGIPDKPDLGDTLLLTPVFKNNHGTMEFNRTVRGAEIAELFRGLCEIRFVDKVLPEDEYFIRYGDIGNKLPLNHACKNYCSIFGVQTKDFIPKIILTEQDKQFAREYIKDLRDPITITPVTGIFPSDEDKTKIWMLEQEKWNELTEELSKKHDILYFSKAGTNFKINNTIENISIELVPNGTYEGIIGSIPSTEGIKYIEYTDNIQHILNVFLPRPYESKIAPLYFKPPHIT